ncbi:MAG TPA: hypothetical protein VJQ44_04675 [Gemmatimonadales bacterium]|nr:hypothetical protein [Gemmatimonadales bacterium]
MPRALPLALLLTGGLLSACTEDHTATSPSEPALVARLARVKIDGAVGNNEWRDAASLDFMVNAPEGLVPARLLAQRDDSHLYLAVVVQRGAGDANTEAELEFDGDNDGVPFEEFDDAFGVGGVPGNSGCFDGYRAVDAFSSFDAPDDLDGGTADCVGALGSTATTTTYEMRQPLDGGDIHDIAVGKALRQVGFELDVRIPLPGITTVIGSGEEARTQVASFGKYCKITVFPAVSLGPCPSGQVASVRVTRNHSTTQIGIITMNPHQADVFPLGLFTYDYLGNPVNATCSWSSTDPAIVDVDADGGLSTGDATGSAVIIAACTTPGSSINTNGQVRVDVTNPT